MKISTKDIKDYLKSKKYQYKIFKIQYTEPEKKSIFEFSIDKYNYFNYYGDYKNMHGLNNFLKSVGENTIYNINKLEQIINKMIQTITKAYELEYYILMIRITLPNNNFDLVRWHKDYGYGGESSKFCFVMKGPGTLLLKSTKEVNDIYHKIFDKQIKERRAKKMSYKEQNDQNENYKLVYAKALKKFKIQQINNNEGVILYAGDREKNINGALHSEPKMNTNRIFISIMPQTKEYVEKQLESQKAFDEKLKNKN
jgi:hypothetical protein